LNVKIILVKLAHGSVYKEIFTAGRILKRLESVECHFSNCYLNVKITQGKIT
jgi:hypothetical protein